ncbi:MAG: geranylgeranylglyceryl/heptaprenylglyceryl phosphate synthase [Marinilabiliaceae bacterium]|nr:geranylgeranylglyceryl/heptaprenylglyceryl phosphate synthase [Marinilabiliaceae bacterium]
MIENQSIYEKIISAVSNKEKLLAFLLDPDKYSEKELESLIKKIEKCPPNLIFVGGSIISTPIDFFVKFLKERLDIPLILFPGHPMHICQGFDAILFLSMISGRNPELLIGNHVVSAPIIKRYGIETISTGYMLIDGGVSTSVEYMSNTRPIPADKTDIIIATAMAGEMMGNKMIYMDAGSGALNAISEKNIKAVKENCTVPLIIGGGIKTPQKLESAFKNGADIVVIGNALEKETNFLEEFRYISSSNSIV